MRRYIYVYEYYIFVHVLCTNGYIYMYIKVLNVGKARRPSVYISATDRYLKRECPLSVHIYIYVYTYVHLYIYIRM